jgi:putative endonuclease
MTAMKKQWSVYIVECSDKTLYTGITTDLVKRVSLHNSGRGSRYTANRNPVRLVYREYCGTKTVAMKRELEIKRYRRKDKLALSKSS